MRKLLLMLLLLCLSISKVQLDLAAAIVELNLGLRSQTNIILDSSLANEELSRNLQQTPCVLLNNLTALLSKDLALPEPMLIIMSAQHIDLTLFNQLPTKLQEIDFLIVGTAAPFIWLKLLQNLWQLGYPNILLYHRAPGPEQGLFYTSSNFPNLKLTSSNVTHFLRSRLHWFDNLLGWEVRVALYNNPPRTLVYPTEQLYDGYALMLLRQFLSYRNATFRPVLTPDYKVYAANDCLRFLDTSQADICGDLLAYSSNYSFTASYSYLYGNILIPNGQPRSKNSYIIAPLQLQTWLLILAYIGIICSFASFVSWWQTGRLAYGKLLLDIISSLLSASFNLSQLSGRLHCILFSTIFLTGFIFSNYYLALLKTVLSTGLYEPQINSFEQLVKQNISFVVGDYDKTVLKTYDFPDILWNITRVVPYDFILEHRRVFDINYAYLAHSDRLALFKFQQQYMIKPRMRPLPIDLMHSLPGFPMRREFLLKQKLSETLLNCFGSGLMQKLADDTNMQTIHIGYLPLIPSEPYEARPLKLDYFAVPLITLILGLAIGSVCLIAELVWHFIQQVKWKRG